MFKGQDELDYQVAGLHFADALPCLCWLCKLDCRGVDTCGVVLSLLWVVTCCELHRLACHVASCTAMRTAEWGEEKHSPQTCSEGAWWRPLETQRIHAPL